MFEHFVVPTEPWINRGSTVEQLLFAVESLLFAVEELLFAVDWAPPKNHQIHPNLNYVAGSFIWGEFMLLARCSRCHPKHGFK